MEGTDRILDGLDGARLFKNNFPQRAPPRSDPLHPPPPLAFVEQAGLLRLVLGRGGGVMASAGERDGVAFLEGWLSRQVRGGATCFGDLWVGDGGSYGDKSFCFFCFRFSLSF